jgi:hypothetical protein
LHEKKLHELSSRVLARCGSSTAFPGGGKRQSGGGGVELAGNSEPAFPEILVFTLIGFAGLGFSPQSTEAEGLARVRDCIGKNNEPELERPPSGGLSFPVGKAILRAVNFRPRARQI